MAANPFRIAITAAPYPPRWGPLLLWGDLPAAFRQAAQSGCQGVEIHLRRASDADAGAVRRLAADYGLGIPTLGTGMAATQDRLTFSDPSAEVRARAVERVRGHIDFAAEVGSAITIGSLSGRLSGQPLRPAALDCLAQVCRLAREVGVTVLLEPLNRYESDYLKTLADAIQVVDQIGAPNLKLLADTFHMNIEEVDLAASLRAAAPHLGHVHLADSNRQAPSHGHLDIAAVLGALEAISYQGYLAFEVLPLPDACTAIRDGVQAVQKRKGAAA